eukprot:2390119-Amphidinium_carterae.4
MRCAATRRSGWQTDSKALRISSEKQTVLCPCAMAASWISESFSPTLWQGILPSPAWWGSVLSRNQPLYCLERMRDHNRGISDVRQIGLPVQSLFFGRSATMLAHCEGRWHPSLS